MVVVGIDLSGPAANAADSAMVAFQVQRTCSWLLNRLLGPTTT